MTPYAFHIKEKKHKNHDYVNSFIKEQNLVITVQEDDLASIIKKLPVAKNNSFWVDTNTAEQLSKLSQHSKNELSIVSVVPVLCT